MRGTSSVRPSGVPERRASEAGFALVEVIVSAVLLIGLALSTLAVLDQSGRSASANRSRGVASSLAQADLDRLRQTPIATLANLRQTQTKPVSGIDYTVVSRADWVTDATGLVTCAGTPGQAQYLKIRSTVTWPQMNGVQPVVAESIVAPGVSALGPNRGAMTAKIVNDAGAGVQGVPVNVGGYGDVTDAGGCVVFGNLPAGNVTVTIGAGSDFVNKDGVRPVVQTQTIVGAQTAQLSPAVSMDHAGTVNVSLLDDASPANPAKWYQVSFGNSGMSAPRKFPATAPASTTSSVTATDLYPFVAPYPVYAGNCSGNDPTTYLGTASAGSVVVPAGAAANVTVTMPLVTITGQGAAVAYSVKPAMGASCTGAIARTTVSSWPQSVALPYGIYTVCVDNGTRFKTATVNNTPAGGTPSPSRTPTVDVSSGTTSGKCT